MNCSSLTYALHHFWFLMLSLNLGLTVSLATFILHPVIYEPPMVDTGE